MKIASHIEQNSSIMHYLIFKSEKVREANSMSADSHFCPRQFRGIPLDSTVQIKLLKQLVTYSRGFAYLMNEQHNSQITVKEFCNVASLLLNKILQEKTIQPHFNQRQKDISQTSKAGLEKRQSY